MYGPLIIYGGPHSISYPVETHREIPSTEEKERKREKEKDAQAPSYRIFLRFKLILTPPRQTHTTNAY